MSLQVWLPFTRNIDNYGLVNIATRSVNSASVTTNGGGKLGNCLSLSSDGQAISLDSFMDVCSTYTGYSMSAWIYMSSTATNHSSSILSSGDWNSGSDQLCFGLYSYYSDGYYKILVPNKSSWSSGISLSNPIKLSTWYNVCITYDGSSTRGYVNGEYVGSYAGGGITSSSETKNLYVGSATYYDGFTLKGSINDVRIYDHCLSAKEVKEISKGLVCHYKLSDPYIESTTNYSSQFTGSGGWNNSGSSTRNNNDTSVNRVFSTCPVLSIQQTAAGNSAMIFGNVSTSTHTALKGATVTASVYAYISDVNCSSRVVYLRSTVNDNKEGDEICAFQYNGSTNPQSWPKNQWIRIEGTGTIASAETAVYFCTYTNNLNEKRYFTCWQLELKDHSTPFVVGSRDESLCFDTSGFGNNGVVKNQNSIFVEKNSPRYGASTVFNGTPFIMGQNLDGAKSTDALTLCAWINPSQVSEGNIISSYEGGGAGLHILSGNIYFQIYSNGYTGVSGGSVSTNTWYHIVGTYDNSKLRIYVNGELKGEVAKTGNITYNSHTPWSVAVNPSGTSDGGEHFYGKLSDVRIYSTALSASDIKELYNTSASVDKNGNMYAYEFKEE